MVNEMGAMQWVIYSEGVHEDNYVCIKQMGGGGQEN